MKSNYSYSQVTWSLYISWSHERDQTQNAIYIMIVPYEMPRIGKSTETEIKLVIARGCRKGRRRKDWLYVYRVPFRCGENVLEEDSGDGYVTCSYAENHWIVLFLNSYFLFLSKRVQAGKGQRERQRIWSRLHTDSREPHVGLKPTNCKIVAWAEVGRLTDWATQVPQLTSILNSPAPLPSVFS